ncbi:hypothetical protein ACTXKO_02945 [Corynebacterium casei]|uniref:hypothetical protein n=1 Tax=Corynebacterium casei TaxID=160386 RepID=UPI003FD11C10
MSETTPEVSEEHDAPTEDSKLAFIPFVLCIVGMLVSPYLVATFAAAASAGWTVLGIFFVLTLGGGLWFGAIHKPTWWFPVSIGIAFMVSRALYFQEGLFLYTVGFALLAGLGTVLTGAGKLDLDEDDDSEDASEDALPEEVKRGEVGA